MIKSRLDPKETTVAVLMGGWSAERQVSLSSGEACSNALRKSGFNVIPIDVTRDRIVPILMDLKPDVAFNALHGKWGEDGCCAGLLETLQFPTPIPACWLRRSPCTRKSRRRYSAPPAFRWPRARWWNWKSSPLTIPWRCPMW